MSSLAYAMPMLLTFVSNMERSLEFYRDALGFHPTMSSEHWSLLTIPGGTTLALHFGGQEKEPGDSNSVPVFSVENIKKAKTELEAKFATARSSPPSPLSSPIATEQALDPVPYFLWLANVPFPYPSKTETVLEVPFVTARSGFPSPSRSPIATERG